VQGYISAALVVGGMDCTGPSLFTIHPHGSVDQLPYVTMGSGSLAAMAIYEAGFQDNMGQEDAVNLVRASIQAGVDNDLGSGSNVDITVIKAGSTERFRSPASPPYPPCAAPCPRVAASVVCERACRRGRRRN
jgi:20S proteasome subunit beta 2